MDILVNYLPPMRYLANFLLLTNKEFSEKIFIKLIDPNNKFASNTQFNDEHNMSEFIKTKREKGSIIISNHPSFIDLTILKKMFPNCYCLTNIVDKRLYTDEEYINKFNLIPYHYDDKDGGKKAKDNIKKLIFEGKDVIVFPEGGFNENNNIAPFKKGLFYLAKENDISILPCSININSNFESNFVRSISYTLDLPVAIPKIDVYISKLIVPSEFANFDDFYNCCFCTVNNGLNRIR